MTAEAHAKKVRTVRTIALTLDHPIGIKEFSDWPTIPQLYVNNEFVGGCDILVSMHQNGELAKLLADNDLLAPAEAGEGEPGKTEN